uniref:Uncharacterized protein n=1 Tax=Photinus pyralis TaxID=7054 RepID=A0A1Y1KNG8_PHOPY
MHQPGRLWVVVVGVGKIYQQITQIPRARRSGRGVAKYFENETNYSGITSKGEQSRLGNDHTHFHLLEGMSKYSFPTDATFSAIRRKGSVKTTLTTLKRVLRIKPFVEEGAIPSGLGP